MKSKWRFLTTALVLAILAGAIYRLWKADHRSAQQTSSNVPVLSHLDKGSVTFSPQKDRGIAIINEKGRTQLWMISVAGNRPSLVMQLEAGEDARNISWSPGGHYFAFEALNPAGHSPMTTTHVWVVDADAKTPKEVRLPAPNQHLSTQLAGWIGDDSVRIRSTLLNHPEDVFFVYRSATGRIEGPIKE
jgi:dipeptidyl aminopeptidase/acylaminoacyl peptidase